MVFTNWQVVTGKYDQDALRKVFTSRELELIVTTTTTKCSNTTNVGILVSQLISLW